MWRRTRTGEVRRLTGERPGTAAMPSVSVFASALKRRSAGSRRSPVSATPSSAAGTASDGASPWLPPPTIWCGSRSSSLGPADMAKVPAIAKAFAGRWRIVEMDVWDNDFLDLVEEAHLTFKGAADGEIGF